MGTDENNVDEVALNVLLADGVDPATAYVASNESPPSKAGFGSFLIWLFLAALAMMFILARLSS